MKTLSSLRAFVLLAAFALVQTSFTHAILDTNTNGMSDLWEKQHNNGVVFPATFLAAADDDKDGWTNATEAIAGTDPFLPNPPNGIIATTIEPTSTEGAFTLTWPTIIGKNYRLQASSNLTDWLNVGTAIVGTTNSHTLGISAVQPDTTVPPKLFWRILASDLDTDTDGLTNAEENTLGTDPNSADSDGDALLDKAEILAGTNPLDNDTDEDGIADNIDTTPLANNALADPDGAGLPANLNSTTSDSNGVKLLARYDFQSVSSGTNGGFPSSIPGIGSASATAVGSDIFQNPSGMPSFTCRWNAAPVFNEYLRLPNSIINTKEKHAWSYWLKLPKNAFYVPPNTVGSGIRTLLSFGNGLVSGGTSTALPHLHWYVNLATNTIELESYFIQNNIGIRQVLGEGWAIPEAWHDGEWHHIVLHQNGSFYKFYFDGVNQGQQETNKGCN